MTKEIKLPPLSEPAYRLSFYGEGGKHDFDKPGYTEDQMKAYATQAVEAYKAQQQGEAEPVARIKGTEVLGLPLLEWLSADHSFRAPVGSLLYTHPAPAQQPLTDEQIIEINMRHYNIATRDYASDIAIARAIESAHNIGAKP
jgi:hypothetical protein